MERRDSCESWIGEHEMKEDGIFGRIIKNMFWIIQFNYSRTTDTNRLDCERQRGCADHDVCVCSTVQTWITDWLLNWFHHRKMFSSFFFSSWLFGSLRGFPWTRIRMRRMRGWRWGWIWLPLDMNAGDQMMNKIPRKYNFDWLDYCCSSDGWWRGWSVQ